MKTILFLLFMFSFTISLRADYQLRKLALNSNFCNFSILKRTPVPFNSYTKQTAKTAYWPVSFFAAGGFGHMKYHDLHSGSDIKLKTDLPIAFGICYEQVLKNYNDRIALVLEPSINHFFSATEKGDNGKYFSYMKAHLTGMVRYRMQAGEHIAYLNAGLDASVPLRLVSNLAEKYELKKFRMVIPLGLGYQRNKLGFELRYTSPEQLLIWADVDASHWAVLFILSYRPAFRD
jgi:hypothetical protein